MEFVPFTEKIKNPKKKKFAPSYKIEAHHNCPRLCKP
jgi:hypothetical protein